LCSGRRYFPYYSYRRNPTGREFFVPAGTLIAVKLFKEYLVWEGSLGPSRLLVCLFLDAVYWWSTRTGGVVDVDQVLSLLKSYVPSRAPTCRPSAEPTAVPSAYMKTKR
jgi:hypothetical protein